MIATILVDGPLKMNTTGNPLKGRVNRNHRIVATVAGPETYGNKNPDAPGESPWYQWVRPGVVRHAKSGKLYIACLPTNAKREIRFTVDGREATEAELAIIRQFTPKKAGKPKMLTFELANVANVAWYIPDPEKDPGFCFCGFA